MESLTLVVIMSLICVAAAVYIFVSRQTPQSAGIETVTSADLKSDKKKKKRKRKQTKKKVDGDPKMPELEDSEEMPDEHVSGGLLRARGVSQTRRNDESPPARQTCQTNTKTQHSRPMMGSY